MVIMAEKMVATSKVKKEEVFPVKNVHYVEIYTGNANNLLIITQKLLVSSL